MIDLSKRRKARRRSPRLTSSVDCRLLFCLATAVLSGCEGQRSPVDQRAAARPNVFMILIDTLRPDRLGFYGYPRDTSPALDALAAQSVVFETVVAQSAQTLISHKSIFSATYPLHLLAQTRQLDLAGLAEVESPQEFLVEAFRDAGERPLLEAFRAAGYQTAAFTDGGWMSREMGFDRGFDVFDEGGGNLEAILPRVNQWLAGGRSAQGAGALEPARGGDPFFLFVHTYDVHCPYPCREPYNSRFCEDHSRHVPLEGRCGKPDLMSLALTETDLRAISDHYDGGIASADAYLGQFFGGLRSVGLFEEALIVVSSDHGESLGGHGQIGHGGLYLEQLLVPLIVKFPSSWRIAPAVIAGPVELVDLLPTLLDACGIGATSDSDGRSLMPVVRGGRSPRDHLIAQVAYQEGREGVSNPVKRAMLVPGQRLLIHDARAETWELFDLQADPEGRVKAAAAGQAPPADLLAKLSTYDPKPPGRRPSMTRPAEISERLKQRLESLGYARESEPQMGPSAER